jgi:hypothetical protein
VVNSSLSLLNVPVTVSAGATGAGGTVGGSGGLASTLGCLPFTTGGGVGGTGGRGMPGVYSSSGYQPAVAPTGGQGIIGDTGGLGSQGCSAMMGVTGAGVTCVTVGSNCSVNFFLYCEAGGTGGCGGPGGLGGIGGSGGGSSIALFAWSGTVTVDSSSLAAGNGGNGGNGGAGAGGSTGGAGLNATLTRSYPESCKAVGGSCTENTAGNTPLGGQGATGATGGTGGYGGGGAGGDSYAYYVGMSATVSVLTTSLVFGIAGSGGQSNGVPNGADGTAATTN